MQQRSPRLERKVAIVTGAGLQRAWSWDREGGLYSSSPVRGPKVLLVDQDPAHAEETLTAIREEGGEASVFGADVTSSSDCEAMVAAALERYGALHVLFNNVGIDGPGSVVDVEEEVWDRVLAVNLKGMMLTSKYAVPRMVEAGGGSIINMSSIVGLRASTSVIDVKSDTGAASTAYAASKGGVISLTTSMAVQHGRENVRVNCIAPGHIYTPMVAGRMTEEVRDLRRRAGPLGTEGTAWDVAWAALFLASDESRWITGVVLPVDAGVLGTTPLSMLGYLK